MRGRPSMLIVLLAAGCAGSTAGPVDEDAGAAGADAEERRPALDPVADFGSNPGGLRMFRHVPAGLDGPAPLVVALHGCGQGAAGYAALTGWVELADRHGFLLVFPEARGGGCFSWYDASRVRRDEGEALSIRQMVDHMERELPVDGERVFATGFSAGGYLTAALLAAYPDVFAAGAVLAGGPAGCDATCMAFPQRSPEDWAAAARAAYPGYGGRYPRLLAFHGALDTVVSPRNLGELREQFTALHDAVAGGSEIWRGHLRERFTGADGGVVVETYALTAFPHAIPVDPGAGADQGGRIGFFAVDADVWSSGLAASFFGIAPP